MQNEAERLKGVLTKAVSKALDIDVSEYVEIDDMEILDDMVSVLCDVTIDGQDFELNLSKCCSDTVTFTGGDYKLVVCCGGCNDVAGANTALNRYDESEIGEVLYREEEIEETGDVLLLSTEFDAEDEERATEVLADILSYLVDEEKSKPLTDLLKYFNG